MSGAIIADQVEAGIIQAALATGNGATYESLLRRKVDGVFEYYEIICVQTRKKSFDAAMMVERINRMILVSPKSEKPLKGDHIAVGINAAGLSGVENWARVGHVQTIEPAGVALLYKLTIEE